MRLYGIFLALLSNTYALLDRHWYVIRHKNDFQPNISKKITINKSPISIRRDENNHFVGVSDVCPHRGESLSKGIEVGDPNLSRKEAEKYLEAKPLELERRHTMVVSIMATIIWR